MFGREDVPEHQPLEGGVVRCQPAQAVLGRHPHDGAEARVREHQVEGVQSHQLAGDDHARELRPVHLGLRSGRGLHAAPGAHRRRRVTVGDEALHRAQAAGVAVFGDQPCVQCGQVRSVVVRHPVGNRVDNDKRTAGLVCTAVAGAGGQPGQMVADSALAEGQLTGNGPLGRALGGQGLDGHADLQIGDRHARSRLTGQRSRLRGRPGGA